MMNLRVPIIAVVIGEGGSGGALGIGVADRVLIWRTPIIPSSARKPAPRFCGKIAGTRRKRPRRSS